MGKKKHVKRYSREVPLFDVGRVEFHTDRDAMRRGMDYASGLTEEDKDISCCSGCCVFGAYDEGGGWVWFVGVFDGKPGTVAHESFHAAVRILSTVDVPIQKNAANETAAYLIGWLVDTFNQVSQEN